MQQTQVWSMELSIPSPQTAAPAARRRAAVLQHSPSSRRPLQLEGKGHNDRPTQVRGAVGWQGGALCPSWAAQPGTSACWCGGWSQEHGAGTAAAQSLGYLLLPLGFPCIIPQGSLVSLVAPQGRGGSLPWAGDWASAPADCRKPRGGRKEAFLPLTCCCLIAFSPLEPPLTTEVVTCPVRMGAARRPRRPRRSRRAAPPARRYPAPCHGQGIFAQNHHNRSREGASHHVQGLLALLETPRAAK